MKITKLEISGACYWEPDVRQDSRGYFYRNYDQHILQQEDLPVGDIVQINQSFSKVKGTFRGFHYQLPPFAEEKIVTCLQGEVLDFVVDLRKGSTTFLQYQAVVLSEENRRSVLIPKGCAHGFITMQEDTRLLYFHTALYKPEYERGILYNDPRLNFSLPAAITELSERDRKHPLLDKQFVGIEL
jgi:dTDP-4-dehydrorhamnose 3,5-epimerase